MCFDAYPEQLRSLTEILEELLQKVRRTTVEAWRAGTLTDVQGGSPHNYPAGLIGSRRSGASVASLKIAISRLSSSSRLLAHVPSRATGADSS